MRAFNPVSTFCIEKKKWDEVTYYSIREKEKREREGEGDGEGEREGGEKEKHWGYLKLACTDILKHYFKKRQANITIK